MGRVMQIAAFSLAEVTYAVGGDIGYQVQESAKQARLRVRTKQENVSGVILPTFEVDRVQGSGTCLSDGRFRIGSLIREYAIPSHRF